MTTPDDEPPAEQRLYRLGYTKDSDEDGRGQFSIEEFRDAELTPAERESLGWADHVFDVTETWQTWARLRGRGARVAVLDTGVDLHHPALADAIVAARDFTRREADEDSDPSIERLDPYAADDDGHGTHCAGIIAARPISAKSRRAIEPNGRDGGPDVIPFQGVAPEAKLLIAKVLSTRENGEVWGEPERVIRGIRWAIRNKADIISMSFAARRSPPELYYAVQQALWLGKFVICAAGNSGALYQNGIGYPGRYGGVLTVAAHDRNGRPAGFSSTGGEIDFIGPGEGIWSTFVEGDRSGYRRLSGTSMAAPFVAGIAALVVAKHKDPGALNDDPTIEELSAFARHDGNNLDEVLKLLSPTSSAMGTTSTSSSYGLDESGHPYLQEEAVRAVREALVVLKRSDAFVRFRASRRSGKNETPLTNNEDLKEHLLRMATRSGSHDSATGYGVLRPLRYFGGEEDVPAPADRNDGVPAASTYEVAAPDQLADLVPDEYPRDGTLIRGADGELYFIPGDLQVYRVASDDPATVVDRKVLEEMTELEDRIEGRIDTDFRLTKTTVAELRPVRRMLPEGVGFADGDLRLTKTTFYQP